MHIAAPDANEAYHVQDFCVVCGFEEETTFSSYVPGIALLLFSLCDKASTIHLKYFMIDIFVLVYDDDDLAAVLLFSHISTPSKLFCAISVSFKVKQKLTVTAH